MEGINSPEVTFFKEKEFKIGIIGCGQIGSMILLRIIEQGSNINLQFELDFIDKKSIIVSTRQPLLISDFAHQYGIRIIYDNEEVKQQIYSFEKVATECDLIFLCCLPMHLNAVIDEIRPIIKKRNYLSSQNKRLNKPLLVSILAGIFKKRFKFLLGISLPKLKLLFSDDTEILRTRIVQE
jgi:pyrroline-5-carboxylate reductase